MARDEGEVRRCFPPLKELRPHLRSADELVERWRIQSRAGYRMIYVAEPPVVVAVAGYRFLDTLAWGRILYVDDLVALTTHHRTGLGTLMLRHLQDEARRAGCDAVHLDTGHHRHLAHRAYLRNGFCIDCHHMAREVPR
jgi:GNAT superfamily N-acetyltransferase